MRVHLLDDSLLQDYMIDFTLPVLWIGVVLEGLITVRIGLVITTCKLLLLLRRTQVVTVTLHIDSTLKVTFAILMHQVGYILTFTIIICLLII